MKPHRVYLLSLLVLVFTGLLLTSGCAVGSGCPTGIPTVSEKTKKNGFKKKKRSKKGEQLFDKKMRKKMN